jgi:hypothetical protein
VPLKDPLSGLVNAALTLEEFNASGGELKLPVTSLAVEVALGGGIADITSLDAELLGGTIEATASIPLKDPEAPASVQWTVTELDIEQLLTAQEEAKSKAAGLVSSTGTASLRLGEIPGSIGGDGEVRLRKGRLLFLPGITQLANLMDVAIPGEPGKSDKADAEFSLTPEGVRVDKSEVVTSFLAARATGTVSYGALMDMEVNAGPMERLQAALGQIGDIFGKLTDQLMTYYVRGPLENPKVTTSVVGIGGGKADAEAKPASEGEDDPKPAEDDGGGADDGAPREDGG